MTSPEAAFTELEERDPGATRPRASGVAAKNADEPAANQSFAHLPPDAGLLGYLNVSLRQRRFICRYFLHLDTEYESLCTEEYKSKMVGTVAELRAAHGRSPSWDLNHRYEYLVMSGLPALILKQRVVIYRERLVALLGNDASLQSLVKAFAPVEGEDFERERMAALGLLAEIQRLRNVRSEFERLRNRLFWLCVGVLWLPLFTAWAAATWHLPLLPNPFPVWAQVATTGLFGGYFSVLLRLGGLRWCAEYNANYQQVDRLFYNVAANFGLSMLEGGVGATILYMLLLANVLSGDVFPRFHDIPKDITEAISAYPVNGTDTAKLLVWALIAGFSERLVPDFLSSLSERKKNGPAATETQVEKG